MHLHIMDHSQITVTIIIITPETLRAEEQVQAIIKITIIAVNVAIIKNKNHLCFKGRELLLGQALCAVILSKQILEIMIMEITMGH